MTLKVNKKKLIASLILFIVGLLALAVFIVVMVLNSTGEYEELREQFWIMPVSGFAYLIFIAVSTLLNISYRKSCVRAGKFSTTLYVFQWIFFAPFVIMALIVLIIGFFCGASVPLFSGGKTEKVIKIKDEQGNKYTLKPTHANNFDGGEEFEDQNGDLWETWDGGQTFERTKRITPVITKDEQGNELKLRPTFRGSERYMDERGDEWLTFDGGKTFERVIKK